MVSIYKTHIRPQLEFSSSLWHTGYIVDLKLLESVQRRWTRAVVGLENANYATRLAVLDLYSVRGRLLCADFIKTLNILHGLSALKTADLFEMNNDRATRGHSLKLTHKYSSIEARRR